MNKAELVRENEHLRQQLAKLQSSLDFTADWYGVRWQRLHQLLKEEATPELRRRACAIMANGTADVLERPEFAYRLTEINQQLSQARRFAARLLLEVQRDPTVEGPRAEGHS